MKVVRRVALGSVACRNVAPIDLISRNRMRLVQLATVRDGVGGDKEAVILVASSAVVIQMAFTMVNIGKRNVGQEVGEGSVDAAEDAIET